jgi:hypothetical protein
VPLSFCDALEFSEESPRFRVYPANSIDQTRSGSGSLRNGLDWTRASLLRRELCSTASAS